MLIVNCWTLLLGRRMDSYDSFPQVPSEDVLLGLTEGFHLSAVRRFFCLLVTFDFLFTSLLWSLCVILVKGEHNLIIAFETEIISYSLQISMFDLVMCAGCRFVILILFYGLLKLSHWLPVALTTASSCAFLVAKVLMFKWNEYGAGSPWPVLLILSSFVLAWVEAWFLDFRVVPIERQASIFLQRQQARSTGALPGVMPWLGTQPSHRGGRSYAESASQFYSPLQSPPRSESSGAENDYSDTDDAERKQNGRESLEATVWKQQGPTIAVHLETQIQASGWILEKSTDDFDMVYSRRLHRKVYLISGIIHSPPEKILNELFHKFESMPQWNNAVSSCKILQKLSEDTDITYQLTREGGKGMISPRDFVTLRHKKLLPNGSYVLASVSVKHSDKPVQHNIIRGTQGVGGWILNRCPRNPRHTQFKWLLDVELELSRLIPSKVVDTAFVATTLETLSCLRLKLSYTVDPADDLSLLVEEQSTSPASVGQDATTISIEGAC